MSLIFLIFISGWKKASFFYFCKAPCTLKNASRQHKKTTSGDVIFLPFWRRFHNRICLPFIFHLLNNFTSSFVKDKSLTFRPKICGAKVFCVFLKYYYRFYYCAICLFRITWKKNTVESSKLFMLKLVIGIFYVVQYIFPVIISVSILLI